ncbi:MAG: MFS transporter [Psychroserpens sp.]|nr:MFS transporter [Psychroserpens sp.]MBO6631102.1 MFS transporter [Psychroserpens sp.]MBO6652432.1 MFS transporter [Psychroserpens sp.]MBO6681796.1 MFS transporter [Psychroserpens sp.]MBO6749571.1 MFS transporter [Psychroserpens sp.]
MSRRKTILPIIVLSQFACTSLWFASNGVMTNLVDTFQLDQNAVGSLTSAIQFGFILGTLTFAILTIADRFSPSRVFFTCAILGALFNTGMIWSGHTISTLLLLRFLTGFCLAGIYPVGMKIAADYYQKGLGLSLGFLVGALVLGTAFPHLIKSVITTDLWRNVIIATSGFASFGGVVMLLFVPNGPYRQAAQKLELNAFFKVFRVPTFRAAAFGYFGHMWELYAFWAFVPVILDSYIKVQPNVKLDVALWSFVIIGSGSIACVIGGYLSKSYGEKRIASLALISSGLCCLLSPIVFSISSSAVILTFLIFWGLVVIADSPLFSTMVAHNAEPKLKGTALTIVNCIGFAITIVSILILTILSKYINWQYLYLVLVIGPLLGLIALSKKSGSTP